jgi:hypothetical protein
MTSEIKSYIEQIRAKAQLLHQDMVLERERSASMLTEISRLKEEIAQQALQISVLKDDLQMANHQLIEKREQVQVSSFSRKDSEIDVLVKEIDFCIQQLKIANE